MYDILESVYFLHHYLLLFNIYLNNFKDKE